MSELEFILLMGVLTENFDTVELVNLLKKIKNFTFKSKPSH
jgi:hypothetical protein